RIGAAARHPGDAAPLASGAGRCGPRRGHRRPDRQRARVRAGGRASGQWLAAHGDRRRARRARAARRARRAVGGRPQSPDRRPASTLGVALGGMDGTRRARKLAYVDGERAAPVACARSGAATRGRDRGRYGGRRLPSRRRLMSLLRRRRSTIGHENAGTMKRNRTGGRAVEPLLESIWPFLALVIVLVALAFMDFLFVEPAHASRLLLLVLRIAASIALLMLAGVTLRRLFIERSRLAEALAASEERLVSSLSDIQKRTQAEALLFEEKE